MSQHTCSRFQLTNHCPIWPAACYGSVCWPTLQQLLPAYPHVLHSLAPLSWGFTSCDVLPIQRLHTKDHVTKTCPSSLPLPTPCCSWNFTPSPGWSKDECQILKLCLMKYGIGAWGQILATGLLPGKLVGQLYGAAQRLLGQQSMAGERRAGGREEAQRQGAAC